MRGLGTTLFALGIALGLTVAPPARAASVIGGPGLISPSVDIDFSEVTFLGTPFPLTNQFGGFGVTFSSGWFDTGCPIACIPPTTSPTGVVPNATNFDFYNTQSFSFFNPNVSISFSSNVTDITFSTKFNPPPPGQSHEIQAFLDGVFVEGLVVSIAQTYGFSGTLFNEIRFSLPAAFVIDDMKFNLAAEATPLPAALPLFATGLGALGLFGWRRKRKAEAIAA